jgi:hypothetical protein
MDTVSKSAHVVQPFFFFQKVLDWIVLCLRMGNFPGHHEKNAPHSSTPSVSSRGLSSATNTTTTTTTTTTASGFLVSDEKPLGSGNQHVNILSKDVFFVISGFLTGKDIMRCEQACRHLRQLCANEA